MLIMFDPYRRVHISATDQCKGTAMPILHDTDDPLRLALETIARIFTTLHKTNRPFDKTRSVDEWQWQYLKTAIADALAIAERTRE